MFYNLDTYTSSKATSSRADSKSKPSLGTLLNLFTYPDSFTGGVGNNSFNAAFCTDLAVL